MFVIIFYEDGAPRVSVNPPRGQISLLDLRLGKLQRTKSQFRIAGLFPLPSREQVLLLKPLANGRNIIGCYMLRPPCCMLLAVVACCCAKFETGQTGTAETILKW